MNKMTDLAKSTNDTDSSIIRQPTESVGLGFGRLKELSRVFPSTWVEGDDSE